MEIQIRKIYMGIWAYFMLNIKSLFIEKISFVWSIALPFIMFFINKGNVHTVKDLSYYWCYMTMNTYIFGLGIYAVEMRESGCLKTIFSINSSKLAYILGNIMTQITYAWICLSVFNVFVALEMKISYFILLKYSLYVMIMCFPLGIGSYFISMWHIFYISSMKTIITIIMFLTLLITGNGHWSNNFNLLFIIPEVLYENKGYWISYIFLSIVLIIIGMIGIYYFDPISKERR